MKEPAVRYGEILYDLAAEEALTERVLQELDMAAACIDAEPQYLKLLTTPNVPLKERCALLDEAFGAAVHPYVVNFLKVLCQEGLLRDLHTTQRAYRTRYNADNGIVEVRAVSAIALSEHNQRRLCEKLAAMTGKKIALTTRVDPTVLGGLRLDLDDMRLDGTVQHRLEALRKTLTAEVSEPN